MGNQNISALEAIERLKEGNLRFSNYLRSIEALARAMELPFLAERGQRPFCIVLSCSDSRIPTEILFDCGPGDLFVARIAGNVATPSILGSIEFAACKFKSPLLLVLGHSRCGAVESALAEKPDPEMKSPNIERVIREVLPAARLAARHMRKDGIIDPEVCLDQAIKINIEHTMAAVTRRSAILRDKVSRGELTILGAMVDLRTGKVHFGSDSSSNAEVKAVNDGVA